MSRSQRRPLSWAVSLALAAAATPAFACTPPITAYNTPAHYAAFAEDMVRAATFVDVLEAESETPFASPELWAAWIADRRGGPKRASVSPALVDDVERAVRAGRDREIVGARYSLRVVRRLKGASPPIVRLTGAPSSKRSQVDQPDPRPPLRHETFGGPVPDAPVPDTFTDGAELSIDNLVYETSCSRGAISFRKGARYLVFRDADGRLLGPIQFSGRQDRRWGYRVVELAPGGPQDWLQAVEAAAKAQAR